MGTKTARRLNTLQCIRLMQNNFLSTDQEKDYDHDEVISRLIQLQSAADSRKLDRMMRMEAHKARKTNSSDFPPPIPYEAMIDYVEEINF